MRTRLEDKRRAIQLRESGCTYNEIRTEIPHLAKGTLSGWMKYLVLSPEAITRLQQRMADGRDRARFYAILANRKRREIREQKVAVVARQEFKKFSKDHLFFIGLALYLAEGSKRSCSFQFINSSPFLIKLMGTWIEQYLKIARSNWRMRLYIHLPYANEGCEKFWSEILSVSASKFARTVYKPTPHLIKKNPSYKGCLRIEGGGIDGLRKIRIWEEELQKYLRL